MANTDGQKYWDDVEWHYTQGRESEKERILSHRYDKNRRYAPYVRDAKTEERERRSTITVLAKFFLFSTAMILFCVLMYIPVYNRANDQLSKGAVAGWSIDTNRDTNIYVQPNNVTTIHEPKDVCPKSKRNVKNNLFLLIIVCSSTTNFEKRNAIRETWGKYKDYIGMSKLFNKIREKYKSYNYTYDLYEGEKPKNYTSRLEKRDISGFGQLLPELARALSNNLVNVETVTVPEERRFEDEDENDNGVLPGFDMNKELGEQQENYDYDYESNIMKIPPKGEEVPRDLERIMDLLKQKNFPTIEEVTNVDPDFKLVFLLGMPSQENDTEVQEKIEEEVQKYGDVVQEGFVDSYNNLTLKSIMMLKWVTNNCNESVRYILKTDDDMYINVPNLIENLRNRSRKYDAEVTKGNKEKEYMLIGDLICGARPVQDSNNKWFSPRYMYGGRIYPRYLSGTGYALSAPTARALYNAALRTHFFHLEDIYITGMCALRASPRLTPRDDPGFSYQVSRGAGAGARDSACGPYARLTAHRVPPQDMRALHRRLRDPRLVDRCERIRLTQVKMNDEHQYRLYVLYKYLRLLVTDEC